MNIYKDGFTQENKQNIAKYVTAIPWTITDHSLIVLSAVVTILAMGYLCLSNHNTSGD